MVQLALERGEVRLAKEIAFFSLMPNRRDDYGTRVVAATGVCWCEPIAVNKRLLQAVISIKKTDPRGEKMRGPLPDDFSGGASVRGRRVRGRRQLTASGDVPPDGPVPKVLRSAT